MVAISMSSMYTVSQPSRISSSNIAFIIAWKVAGELVRPKNMTVGLYSPSFVMKAAFHSSPFLNTHVVVAPVDVKFGEEFLHPNAID